MHDTEYEPFTWDEYDTEARQVQATPPTFDDSDPMLIGALEALIAVQQAIVGQTWSSYCDASEAFWQLVYRVMHTGWTEQDCYDSVQLLAMWSAYDDFGPPPELTAEKWIRNLAAVLVNKRTGYGKSLSDPVNAFSCSDAIEQCASRIDAKISRLMRCDPMADTEDTRLDLAGYCALMIGLLNSEDSHG